MRRSSDLCNLEWIKGSPAAGVKVSGPACGGLIMTLKLPSVIAAGTSALNQYMTSCSEVCDTFESLPV